MSENKPCIMCLQHKKVDDFRRFRNGELSKICKACHGKKISEARQHTTLEIKEGDWCRFWNDETPNNKSIYQFHSFDKKRKLFVSIDKNDEDDLSWWEHCELAHDHIIVPIKKIDHSERVLARKDFNKSMKQYDELNGKIIIMNLTDFYTVLKMVHDDGIKNCETPLNNIQELELSAIVKKALQDNA